MISSTDPAFAPLGRVAQVSVDGGSSASDTAGQAILEAALALCPTARRATLAIRHKQKPPDPVAARDHDGSIPIGTLVIADSERAASAFTKNAKLTAEKDLGKLGRALAFDGEDGTGHLVLQLTVDDLVVILVSAAGDPLHGFVEDPAGEAFRVLAALAERALTLPEPTLPPASPAARPMPRAPGPIRERQSSKRAALENDYEEIIGDGKRLVAALRIVDRAAQLDVPVLIHGETGTGKELIARAIHRNGPRAKKRLVTINAAALTETLLESELFGYMKGAFTGADRNKQGLFELASGGTLFLDEIGEMPLEMQKKLLRVLQEGEVMPLGAREVVPVDTRVIVATNRDLLAEVDEGRFRQDLYYRLSVLQVPLPPLRERREDILPLIQHFLTELGEKHRRNYFLDRRDPRVQERLTEYGWPGNIRQLENVITNMASLCGEIGALDFKLLPGEIRGEEDEVAPPRKVRKLDDVLDEVEKGEITNALRVTGGNRLRAAKLLGVNRRTLLRRLEKHGLNKGRRGDDEGDDGDADNDGDET